MLKQNQLRTYYISKTLISLGSEMNVTFNNLLNNLIFVHSVNVLIAETRLNVILEDVNKLLLVKTTLKNKYLFDNATSTSLFKHFKPCKHFFFLISLARLNWVYDVVLCLALTQMFATADHNIKMFSKNATFLQNQFIKKLNCDLIS